MTDSSNIVVRTEINGFRNVVIRASLVSDGSGLSAFVLYDATSTGDFGVLRQGQTFYPGINTKVVGLDYDVQDMKIKLSWDATSAEQIMALGSAPEDFSWKRFGGIRVPDGLTGATGSILIDTINAAPGSTFMLLLYLTKGVPQS